MSTTAGHSGILQRYAWRNLEYREACATAGVRNSGFHSWGSTLVVDFEKKMSFNINEHLKGSLGCEKGTKRV